MNQCPRCHAEILGNPKYCQHCGFLLQPETSSGKKGLLFVLFLILFSLCIFFISIGSEDRAEEIVTEELALIKNNQWTEAYYSQTSKEFQAATSLDDFKKFMKSFPLLLSYDEVDIEPIEDQDNSKIVRGIFKNHKGEALTLNFQLIEQDDKWKILNIKALSDTNPEEDAVFQQYKDVLLPIENQLKALDKGDLTQAYNEFVSTEFKKNTSLDAFKQFITSHPILTAFEKYDLIDIHEDDPNATVKLKFSNPDVQADVDYTMEKEGNNWKVRGIVVTNQENTPSSIPNFNAEELLKPLKDQLQELKANNIKKAYDDYTSTGFKQSTSLENFEKFIEKYPVFKNNKYADFYKLTFNNNIGMYNARLKSAAGEEREIEYALIKENGHWKILQIEIFENPK